MHSIKIDNFGRVISIKYNSSESGDNWVQVDSIPDPPEIKDELSNEELEKLDNFELYYIDGKLEYISNSQIISIHTL